MQMMEKFRPTCINVKARPPTALRRIACFFASNGCPRKYTACSKISVSSQTNAQTTAHFVHIE